jgi:hypothetical protein
VCHLTTRSSGRSCGNAIFGVITPPLSASVRLPIVVPHPQGNARMKSALEWPLRFRGRRVAAVQVMPSGVQAIAVLASSGPGAGCVRRFRQGSHKVPRSRSSAGRQRCGLARPILSSDSSVWLGGVCRCPGGRVHSPLRSQTGASFAAVAGARVRSAQELSQLSQSFTHGSLTTRSSGPVHSHRGRASGAPAILRRPRA